MGRLDDLIANPRNAAPPKGAAKPSQRPATGRAAATGNATDIRALLEGLRAPQRPSGASGGALPPISMQPLQKARDGGDLLGDIGGGLKDVGSSVGRGLLKAIDIVDTPRAAVVSGLKELGDFVDSKVGTSGDDSWYAGEDNKASFQDFKDQMWRNMGAREIIENSGFDSGNGGVNTAIGFAADLALDPTTYVGASVVTKGLKQGAKAAGVDAGEDALRLAVQHGGRNEIAKTLAKDGASDRVLAAVAQKGRGGLTRKGLREAGASADEVAKYGDLITGYRVGVHGGKGIAIPGTRIAAEGAENLKGSLKQVLGRTAAAKTVRKLRVSDDLGERAALDVMRKKGATVAEKATATRLLSVINDTRGAAAKFVKTSELSLKQTLASDLRGLSADESSRIVHALESGQLDDVSGKVRAWFDGEAQKLSDLGIEVKHRSGYVPHRLTPEFKELARENPEVATYVERLTKREALQQERTLVAGETFMGVPLVDGSIKEINRIAQDSLGVKALKDDVRELIGDYMTEAGHAFGRKAAERNLLAAGIGKEIGSSTQKLTADAAQLVKPKKSFAKQLEKQAEIVDKAASTRRGALKKARARLDEQIAVRKTALDDVTRRMADETTKAEQAVMRVSKLESELATRQAEVEAWRKVAGSARRTERKGLLKKIADAETDITKLEQELVDAREFAERWPAREAMQPEIDRLGEEITGMYDQRAGLDAQLQDVSGPVPNVDSPLVQEQRLATEMRRQDAAKQRLDRARSDMDIATLSEGLLRMRLDDVKDGIQKELDKFVNARKLTTNLPAGGKRFSTRIEARNELRDRVQVVMAALRSADDPAVEVIARIETQAALYDMKAFKQSTTVAQLKKEIDVMETPGFREHIAQVFDDGFKAISETTQVPAWVEEAMTVTKQIRDPKWWDGYMGYYRQSLNWWKAWAVASPGFVARNLQGGIFNMYLDGVSLESGRMFKKLYKVYSNNPNDYMQKITAQFDEETARRFDDALTAAGATGWGMTPQEVSTALVETKASWSPLRADNKITRPVRKAGEQAEAWMRGTHAYDVISRGGTVDQAADRVNMFHFNYRDITDFDRNVKLVSPFWMFYSRNMSLQAQVWTRYPHKLNRSYFNLKRNMEYGQEEEVTPDWMEQAGAIQTPWERNGDSMYWMPDIPSLRFAKDVGELNGPMGIVQNLAPVPKLGAELLAGKQSFSGAPFKDSFQSASYDAAGNRQEGPREAPGWAQLPGISQVLDAVGAKETYADGTPVMTDRVQYALENMVPPFSRANALIPNQANKEQTHLASIASFLGAGVRQNTPQMQESELWRRRQLMADEANRLKELGYGG